MGQVLWQLDQAAAFLASQPDVVAACAFGSLARGTAGPTSDVDLAVLLDPQENPLARRDRLCAALMALLGREDVDLVLMDRVPPLLQHRIVREGRLLFVRDPERWSAFATRAVLEYLDTAPLRAAVADAVERRLAAGWFGRAVPYRAATGHGRPGS